MPGASRRLSELKPVPSAISVACKPLATLRSRRRGTKCVERGAAPPLGLAVRLQPGWVARVPPIGLISRARFSADWSRGSGPQQNAVL
jgi:hypothetical protein